jgi:hypothetical protein
MKTCRWFFVLLVLISLSIMPRQSTAAFYSGNDLVADMSEWDKFVAGNDGADLEKAYGYGRYIIGVYDATDSFYDVPNDLSRRQIVAVVTKYLKNHPEEWSYSAAFLVKKALREAFPKKSK